MEKQPNTASSKMGKQAEKAHRRKSAILSSARMLLIEEGSANFTMRKVAARAGIHLASLQYYYATKDKLTKAVMEESVERQMRHIDTLAQNSELPATEKLHAALKSMFEYIKTRENAIFAFQIWSLTANDPRMREMIGGVYRRMVEVLASVIQEANPSLSKKDAEKRSLEVIALNDGFMLHNSILMSWRGVFSGADLDFIENAEHLVLKT